jgi:hypothetical protein
VASGRRELRDVLVRNGILNPDYTPNEETAARLGWRLLDADEMPQNGLPPRARAEMAQVTAPSEGR